MKLLLVGELCGLLVLASCTQGGADVKPPAAVAIYAGDAQVGQVGGQLPVAASVRVVDATGAPTPNITVAFTVTAGAGSVSAETSSTNADGVASVIWTLGSAPGANALEAVVAGLAPVTFTATATSGPPLSTGPAAIVKSAGDLQVAAPGAAVTTSPTVVVVDQAGHPVPNVVVDFVVTSGGGVAWCNSVTTDANGSASCPLWALGPARGTNTLAAAVSGLAPAVFTATVQADVLLDLGHAEEVSLLKMAGTRLLSWDRRGHWVLWDVATCTAVASGDTPCTPPFTWGVCTPSAVDLAGPTVLITSQAGLELRDASSGRVLSRMFGTYGSARLASDGAYMYHATTQSLSAWAPDGQPLFSRPGDYSRAITYADGTALRVANGPAGSQVIETIDPWTGVSSTGQPFNGNFHSWFTNGKRFLTNLSTTVWVYASAGSQEAILSLPTLKNLTGQGDWLWTYADTVGYPLTVYRVDGGGAPAATYALDTNARPLPSGDDAIGIAFYGPPNAAIIDLSGAAPSRADYTLPIAYPSVVRASTNGRWFVASRDGVILDGTSLAGAPRYCGLGTAWSVAGGGNRVAVATASGSIRYFDAATSAVEGEIAFSGSKLQLSSDGTVLAAAAVMTHGALKIFSLPTGSAARSWPYSLSEYPILWDFSLAGSGSQIGQMLGTSNGTSWTCDRQVSPVDGGVPMALGATSDCYSTPLLLSPAGNRVAFSVGAFPIANSTVTDVYQDGTLVGAMAGRAVGWIDDGRLLVNEYVFSGGRFSTTVYAGAEIHDATGAFLAALPLPELAGIQTIDANSVYSPDQNAIFSLDTGAALWTGPSLSWSGPGAVAGGRVVYPLGSYVLSESY